MFWSLVKSDDFARIIVARDSLTHTPWVIPHSIEEGSNYIRSLRKFDFDQPTRSYAYAKFLNRILTNLHTILKTHIGIKMCTIKISFICGVFDSPTQSPAYAKLKKPENQFLAPFWKPISAKMKNSLKFTSIVWVLSFFVHKKLIYAYANDFHMIFIFHRIWNRDNLLVMTSSVKFRL